MLCYGRGVYTMYVLLVVAYYLGSSIPHPKELICLPDEHYHGIGIQ